MKRMKLLATAGLAAAFLWSGSAVAQTTLKLASLAPEGSIWMQALQDAKTEIETATGGEVKLKIYPGGIMGSEKDVLFKIKTGQLQGGGFMGYAIGKICPDSSALMFPMVEMSVLFSCRTRWFSVLADDRPFFRVARGTRSTLISVKP